MLTGEPPFFGSPDEVIHGHRAREAVRPSRRAGAQDVPSELDAIVLRCLEKRPDDRFKTMEEVSRELRTLLPGTEPEPFDEEITGRWKIPPEIEQQEEPLPESPARLRRLFYDTLLELAEHAVEQGLAADQLSYDLGEIDRVRGEVSTIGAENAATENRFEDIRRELRERESTLRYAIIDLNLARSDVQEQDGDAAELEDIEAQITELERSLSELEGQRTERFAGLNRQLQENREKLKSMEQQMVAHYRRVYAYLDGARPDLKTDEARRLYRLLERCRTALTQATRG
jgi:DNA repair exonuclease SbcCD ATPase subunit